MGEQLNASYAEYERTNLSWVRQKVNEAMVMLKKERAYNDIATSIDYVNGEQFPLRSKAISNIVDNKLRKIVLEICSAMTDVRPIWNYSTYDDKYKEQAELLNKLARSWWRNSRADRKLWAALMYSCVGGSGYLALTWNPSLPGGGDLELIPFDPRNVLPIEPVYSDSIQDWQGVILRQRVSIETVKKMYPAKASAIGASGYGSWFGPEGTKGRVYDVMSTVWSILKGRTKSNEEELPGSTDLIRVYLKDNSVHTGDKPRQMGDPDSNWSYLVYPVGSINPQTGQATTVEEARLYPRGRLIVCNPDTILHDGPNFFWHGYFPVIRFTLDPLPWSLLGSSLVSDLIPIQNALNESLRGAEDAIAQWIRRGVVADKNALSPDSLKAIDTRRPGIRVLTNPNAGEGFKVLDGPQLPDFYMNLIQLYRGEIDENSGIRDFKALQQMQKNPNEEELEKMMDALSPLLRGRARSIELALAELAEMLKVCFFQYYNAPRRMQILGEKGLAIEDFDYDPGTLVPSDLPGDTREERASQHHRNFTFDVEPDSFLNVNHMMKKMMVMQLFRANGIDIYSAWQALDLDRIGPIPGDTLPERMIAARKLGLQPGPTPEIVQAQEQAQLMQTQMMIQQMQAQALMQQMAPMGQGGPQGGPGQGGPGGGPPPGPGGPQAPPTSGTGPHGGRPPSGGQPPQFLVKQGPEGPRAVVSESGG